ncbi:Phenylalanyl-tRNA synthetase, alpha subunit [Nitrosotalea sinensis]|jgi:phenylalanyl-tRNA synthetase alpha chain|uniref:phenylalanine--tRNA ligase n=1 Tax=Nitrosotalea sinensis TaxID=1499975 RepID=A0A2H1EGN1_9ARCH|nr:phenylalanine--tRNA ligase subunit alpha [Candidatus Nitrosotalea sinensis]SHO44849.1 Phenylalanyl-tRNA synthetase, alpha subunit [Candidatus Nitrosotalea sinensis]
MSQVLHPIEQKILKTLAEKKNLTPEELASITKLSLDQIRRGIEWLKFKNLTDVQESETNVVTLGKKGPEAIEKGLPERQLLNHLRSLDGYSCEINDAKNYLKNEFSPAIANAKKNGWIEIHENRMMLKGYHDVTPEEKILKTVSKSPEGVSANELEKNALDSLKKRPDLIAIISKKSTLVGLTEKGIDASRTVPDNLDSVLISDASLTHDYVRAIDVEADAPLAFAARSHPLRDVIDEVREIFVSLGFSEIIGNNVQSSFWNFDALFTPQDHPAREMQDTFYLKDIKAGNVAKPDQIRKVSESHKKGWNYNWQSEEAKKLVLRTHTTCVTIRELADQQYDEARLFSIGRVFRNEKLSYKHLAEFHQVEGVVMGTNVTLRDLMGLQTEFYHKMGIKKIKFWPTFFPYTEPSLQSMIYNEKLGKWVELFGMGIFRPEVTKPLGIKNPVLAWGGGIERIAMLRFGLQDVRDLYENKFGWLRSVPKCP